MWYEWVFEGIGTELVSLILGLIIGGIAGYKIGVKNHNTQTQTAGSNSNLTQIGNVTITGEKGERKNGK